MAVELSAQGLRVDQVELVRLVHRPLQTQGLQLGGEVDEGCTGSVTGMPWR